MKRVLVLSLGLVLVVGCKKNKPVDPNPTGSASAASSVVAQGSASAVPSAAQAAGLVPYAEHTIAAGDAPDGTWTPAYTIERKAGDENFDWSRALEHCTAQGRSLCSDTQWLRACAADAELGKLETWTLTADVPGAVVRGGPAGCGDKKFVKVTEASPTRAAVCCQRAVAIRTENKNASFLASSSKKLLDYEVALLRHEPAPLGALYDDNVTYLGKELARDDLVKAHEQSAKDNPDLASFFDHCTVKIDNDGVAASLVADCGVVQRRGGKVSGLIQRVAYGGPASKIQYVGDPSGTMKKREQKERVRSFLPSGQ
jgi:hypothetical protein